MLQQQTSEESVEAAASGCSAASYSRLIALKAVPLFALLPLSALLVVSPPVLAQSEQDSAEVSSDFTLLDADDPLVRGSGFTSVGRSGSEMQTELSFKLSPGKFDFSSAGAFGLGGVFSNPELAINSTPSQRSDLEERLPDIHDGLSYSAGFRIEHEDKDLLDTAYVSSGQLGLSYGRLGQIWYSGVDVDLSIATDTVRSVDEYSDVLSLDFTTGRRISWTGLGPHDPMWLFSLQGNFDIQSGETGDFTEQSDWYLNPSLFWKNPDFTFSAQLQLPMDSDLLESLEDPDYTLRAIFEKQFK